VYRGDFRDGGFLVNEKLPALRDERALVTGTWDADVLPVLEPKPGDFVLDKNRPSSFYATPLETWLNGLGARELVVCGVTTNVCVETTVRDASQRDYRTFVLQDAVAEYDPERQAASLKAMGMLFAHLTSVDSLERAWS
jgi:ureidoacrylate peracid hydrolase